MNTEAIYSDETGQYVIPMEANPGDRVTIRLRVAHGHAREIYLLAQDTHYLMRPAQAGERFDYYETQVQLGDQSFSYCFSIRENEQEQCYFDKYGVSQDPTGVCLSHPAGLCNAGLGKGRYHVSDPGRPFCQRRSDQ